MTRVLLSPFGHLDLLGVTQTAGIQKVSTICSDSGGSPCPVPAGRLGSPNPPCPPRPLLCCHLSGNAWEAQTRMTRDCGRGLRSNFPEWVLSG